MDRHDRRCHEKLESTSARGTAQLDCPKYSNDMETESVRFEHPPVRVVELTIFFDQVSTRLTSIAPLVSQLQQQFPDVTEQFAREPWKAEDEGADFTTWLSDADASFPFPWLTFSDRKGRSISFQSDRFLIRWEFGDDLPYPGYEQLKEVLEHHYSLFQSHLDSSLGVTPVARRARAEYENQVSSDVAWSTAQQAFSPGRQFPPNPITGLQGTSSGGLFHFSSSDYVTHVDFAAFSEVDDGSLSLRSTTKNGKDDAIDWVSALDCAHERLIHCFLQLSTDEQKSGWGIK